MSTERLQQIRDRLASVAGRPWKFNPNHEMFVGTTNMLQMYDRQIDLGRDHKEYYPTPDGYKISEGSIRRAAASKALGEFFENCREDIEFLLGLLDRETQRDRD